MNFNDIVNRYIFIKISRTITRFSIMEKKKKKLIHSCMIYMVEKVVNNIEHASVSYRSTCFV